MSFFLKAVIVVTTEDGVSLNPTATQTDGEAYRITLITYLEGNIPLVSL